MINQRSEHQDLAEAVREVARALLADKPTKPRQNVSESRRQVAGKLMDWANLVFVGLVIAQAFSAQFDFALALVGVSVFAGAYFFAYFLSKGGGSR